MTVIWTIRSVYSTILLSVLALVAALVLSGCSGGSSSSGTSTTSDTSTTPEVSLSCTPGSASESSGKITCMLSLSATTAEVVTMEVSYSGTATAGTDYSGNTKTHTINSGNTATWSINVKSDNVAEGNETIVVEITSVTNATESGIQIETLTITDAVIIDETVCKQDLTYSGVAPDMWTGCYSTDSDDNAIWEGACKLESVDTSNFVYLHFGVSSECNFDWVRAAGDVGDTWQSLASSSANWSSSEFVIKHTGAKVHELKLCVNGVSGGPPDWCK